MQIVHFFSVQIVHVASALYSQTYVPSQKQLNRSEHRFLGGFKRFYEIHSRILLNTGYLSSPRAREII